MIDLTTNLNKPTQKTSVAVGLFDGLHLGHLAVIDEAISYAAKFGVDSAVFTFDSDSVLVNKNAENSVIIPNDFKLKMIEKLGITYVFSPKFSKLKDYSPKEFVYEILQKKLGACNIVCGRDFRFGKNAAGNCETLTSICSEIGISVKVVDDVLLSKDAKISSSEIRKLIKNGEIKAANEMLGYRYKIIKPVEYGKQIGRQIDFPTINQHFSKEQLVPFYGVYSSTILIGEKRFDGITNIGVKPTVSTEEIPLAETHIIGYNGNLYGETIAVELDDFIRPERKFFSLEELKAQILKDVKFSVERKKTYYE